jgi:ribonuclease HI
MKHISIYTDGACSGNPGKGGWGAVLIYGHNQKEISGYEPQTTNNRMELIAIIKALESLKEKCKIDLYVDSKYAKDGISTWIKNWKQNGWRSANKQPIKNQDLWQELDSLCQNHEIAWHFVKGHSNDKFNDKADLLATNAIKNAK